PGLTTLRLGERWGDALATLVLVLRPSRGLHHRLAVLRDRHRSAAGLLPQTGVRLPGPGDRDHLHCRTVGDGVGASHVRHGPSAVAVLRGDEHADRRAHGGEVLQLGGHHVAWQIDVRDTHAVVD